MFKKLIASIALIAAAIALSAQNIPQSAKDRAADLVSKMTLEEKVGIIAGAVDGFHTMAIPRLGIPSIAMCDGPQGVRNKTISTLYPCGVAAAASWNKAAVYDMGRGIGQDAKARGVGIMLGPGVNIYRSALNGRNFEYFGEDPYLASETAVQYIKGMQSEGVIATIKHFAMNNQEYDRHRTGVVADERTIQEIYFPTFRRAVQEAGVGAIMTSYNMVNGQHAPENPWMLKEVLRKEWGFEGLVMSDWTSTYSTLGCIKGGLDLEMPKNYTYRYEIIKELIDNGVVCECEIDVKVRHILQTLIAFGLFDRPAKDESLSENNPFSNQAASALADEAPVLLKNEGLLPAKPGKKNLIVVTGPMADFIPCGGGSGEVTPFEECSVTVRQGFEALGKNWPVKYLSELESPESVQALKSAKTVVVAVGYGKKAERENHDRTFTLPEGQDELIAKVLEYNPNVVVTVISGGEVDMSAWADKVKAIIMGWYDGQDLGAIARIVSGKVNPSGRLPMTLWGSLENNPVFKNYNPHMTSLLTATSKGHRERFGAYSYTEYREGIFLGYRGAEHFGVKPLYPFGYGLSYSNIVYDRMDVVPGADGTFSVEVTLRNASKVPGSEVVQIYVAAVNPKVARPVRELKAFDKVRLEKGETKTVTVALPKDAFAYYDVCSHSWKTDPGVYKIQVCTDAETVVAETEIAL